MYGGSCGGRGIRGVARRPGHLFGVDVEGMSAGIRVAVALAVLGPVALSGVVLAFTPVWWIFTTYFWVAFPALGLLGSGISGLSEARPERVTGAERERELLRVMRSYGEVSAAGAAAETSMTVAEANRRLGELAEGGHLEVRVRGGAILYALWEYGDSGDTQELGGLRTEQRPVEQSGA